MRNILAISLLLCVIFVKDVLAQSFPLSDSSVTGPPVVSSCGSGTLVSGSTDRRGQISGVTAATACTLTFSSPLKAAPVCLSYGSAALAAPLISSIGVTSVTFGMTAFTGTLYYMCF